MEPGQARPFGLCRNILMRRKEDLSIYDNIRGKVVLAFASDVFSTYAMKTLAGLKADFFDLARRRNLRSGFILVFLWFKPATHQLRAGSISCF